jgi:hypothetical protein
MFFPYNITGHHSYIVILVDSYMFMMNILRICIVGMYT